MEKISRKMKRETEEMRKERKKHSTENLLKLILWMALLTGSIPILTDPYSTVWKQNLLTPTL